MICPSCSEAGQINADIKERPRLWAALADRRDYLHNQCAGGCDCQHKTGLWVNPAIGTVGE